MTQAEVGHAALRVGGSVLSGMRTLGGVALSAAKSQVVSAGSGSPSRHAAGEVSGGGVARFFSRSAPSEGVGVVGEREEQRREREEEQRRERRYASTSSGFLVLRIVDELVSNEQSFFVFLCTDWLSYCSPCLWKSAQLLDFVFRDS